MKTRTPFNCLTLLDIRYGDLYFSPEQKQKAIDDISNDLVFSAERVQIGTLSSTDSASNTSLSHN